MSTPATALQLARNIEALPARIEDKALAAEVSALIASHREQQSMIASLKEGRADIRVLGGSECFIRTDADGIMQGFRTVIELSYREGKIYTVDASENANGTWSKGSGEREQFFDPTALSWHVTGAGANEIANVSSINISRLREDTVEWNPQHTKILRITIHLLAVGRDKAGNWRAEQLSLPFAMRDEFLETVAAKSRIKDFSALIQFGLKRDFADSNGNLPKGHKWECLDDEGTSEEIGFLCNLTHWKVRDLFLSKSTRNKNAAKKAQTVAKRLILSSWFGLARVPVVGKGNDIVARIPVWGWQSPIDQDRVASLARHIAAGRALSEFKFADKPIDVKAVRVTSEQISEGLQGEAQSDADDTPEDWQQPDGSEPAKPENKPEVKPAPKPAKPEKSEARAIAEQTIAKFDADRGPDAAMVFLGDLGLDLTTMLEMGADDPTWLKVTEKLLRELKR